MGRHLKFLWALSFLLCLISCNKEIIETTVKGRVLKASFYESGKAALDSFYQLFWFERDEISLFESPVNEKYQFDGQTGDVIGTFSKADETIPQENYARLYAVYPYSKGNTCSVEGKLTTELPAEQSYRDHSFDPKSGLMVAVTQNLEDENLRFKNVCGFLKLKIFGGDIIKSISLKGNNGEILAGTSEISAGFDKNPEIKVLGKETEIILNCGDGKMTGKDETHYTSFIFTVPPVDFKSGITITITNSSGDVIEKTTSTPIRISRNVISNIAPFCENKASNTGIDTFSIETSGGEKFDMIGICNNIIHVVMPWGTDLTMCKASFKHFGEKMYVGDVEQTSGVSINDFTSDVTYTVVAKTGATEDYTVKVLYSNLPVLYITTPDNRAVESKTEWVDDSSIKIINEDGLIDLECATSIKCRGNVTFGFPKKPYTLKLESKKKVLGMNKDKRWNLLSGYDDRTRLHNAVAFEIANYASGLEWTPSGTFVELILNGKHLGNYYLCEKIKISKDRINIQELEAGDEDDTKVTGGYILEYDTYFDEAYKFRSSAFNFPVNLKSPDENVPQKQLDYIEGYINNLESIFLDNTRIEAHEYQNYLDVNSFVDYWLVNQIYGNGELSHPKSCYMYKGRDGYDSEPGTISKLKAGPVWDLDRGSFDGENISLSYVYYPYLFQDPEFVETVKQRWNLLEPLVSANIPSYIIDLGQLIKNSAHRDGIMWFNSDDDSEMAANQLSERVKARIKAISKCINNL